MVDANIWLKSKACNIKDDKFVPGWAYLVEDANYKKHLKKHVEEKEVSIFVMIM